MDLRDKEALDRANIRASNRLHTINRPRSRDSDVIRLGNRTDLYKALDFEDVIATRALNGVDDVTRLGNRANL